MASRGWLVVRQKVVSASILAIIAVLSLVVYTINMQRLNVYGNIVDCGNFTISLPPGEYTLNYTVYGVEGVNYITVYFTVDNSTCKNIRGVIFVDGQRTGLPWVSPTIYGPYVLPSLDNNVSVNIVPLFYATQALLIYYPVNASKIASGILETPYGAMPVDVYEYTMEYQTASGKGYDHAKLYYDKASGLLVGASYTAYIEGMGEIISYTLKLSDLLVKPVQAQFSVKDLPTTIAFTAATGVIGGAAAVMVATELSRKEHQFA